MEAHKVRGGGNSVPSQPMQIHWPNLSTKNDTTVSPTPTAPAKDLHTPSSDISPVVWDHEWYYYSVITGITPEHLNQFQDPSLAESKALAALDPDTEMSNIDDESLLLSMLEYCRQDDDEDPSSGDQTPASEAWEYWEEIPELKTYNIDSETLVEVLKDPLDTLFQEWVGEICCADTGGEERPSPSSSSAVRSSGQQPSRSKRKRADDPGNEDSGGPPNKLRTTEKRSRKLMPLHKSLACPYFKKDSRRHRACCGFGFTKISYVKAHIYRKHAIPIYCPICRDSFENVQLRDDHNRERNCEAVENEAAPDGITSEQRDWLHQRGPRGLTEEQQWFRTFEFLFPGHPVPRSPYNDTTFSEDMLNFRDYVSSAAAQEILLQRVRENPIWTTELEAIFRPDLVHGLDQLYWRWAATDHHQSGQEPAIQSSSQESGTSSTLAGDEDADASTSDSQTRVGERSDQSTREPLEEEAFEPGISATVDEREQGEEPRVEPSEALLVFKEVELEERKVDEEDQMPPRQLNHDGIDLVLNQHQCLTGLPEDLGLAGLEYADYDPLAISNDIDYGLSAADYALLNPVDDIEGAEDWISNIVLPDHEASLPLGGPEGSAVYGPSVDLGVVSLGDPAPAVDKGKKADSKELDDFIRAPRPPT